MSVIKKVPPFLPEDNLLFIRKSMELIVSMFFGNHIGTTGLSFQSNIRWAGDSVAGLEIDILA